MFITFNRVRLDDTDAAGILFFANQFRFIHDALDDFFDADGHSFNKMLFEYGFIFVIVHAESDYLAPLTVGDNLEIHVMVKKIGTTSFIMMYNIYKSEDHSLVGTSKTIHVCVDRIERTKLPIPDLYRSLLGKHAFIDQ